MKITKAEAGYLSRSGTEFTCGDCCFLKSLSGGAWGCAYFGHSESISRDTGSCNRFALGKRGTELPFLDNFTKLELGYTENPTGFGCKRCVSFSIEKRDCKRVDKDSPGDTPEEIATTGCCDLQTPDSWRGKLSTPELSELIQLTDTKAARMTPDQYRRFTELRG